MHSADDCRESTLNSVASLRLRASNRGALFVCAPKPNTSQKPKPILAEMPVEQALHRATQNSHNRLADWLKSSLISGAGDLSSALRGGVGS